MFHIMLIYIIIVNSGGTSMEHLYKKLKINNVIYTIIMEHNYRIALLGEGNYMWKTFSSQNSLDYFVSKFAYLEKG